MLTVESAMDWRSLRHDHSHSRSHSSTHSRTHSHTPSHTSHEAPSDSEYDTLPIPHPRTRTTSQTPSETSSTRTAGGTRFTKVVASFRGAGERLKAELRRKKDREKDGDLERGKAKGWSSEGDVSVGRGEEKGGKETGRKGKGKEKRKVKKEKDKGKGKGKGKGKKVESEDSADSAVETDSLLDPSDRITSAIDSNLTLHNSAYSIAEDSEEDDEEDRFIRREGYGSYQRSLGAPSPGGPFAASSSSKPPVPTIDWTIPGLRAGGAGAGMKGYGTLSIRQDPQAPHLPPRAPQFHYSSALHKKDVRPVVIKIDAATEEAQRVVGKMVQRGEKIETMRKKLGG
ncbi:hypothetical protein HDV00_003647 [Rhizophlyctis rosea]|nr:hypothetical protein HDV00_003647 [Rhizophlyctis rosea]